MIFLNEEILKDKANFLDLVDNEKSYILNNLKVEISKKDILLSYAQKFSEYPDFTSLEYIESTKQFWENLKICLSNTQNNINLLNLLLENLSKITADCDIKDLVSFNEKYSNTMKIISENNITIEKFLQSTASLYLELNFSNIKEENTIKINEEINNDAKNVSFEIPKINIDEKVELVEKTLIISETKGKVILPYDINILENKLKDNSTKYSGLSEIVNNEYTLNLKYFKNFAVARFRESYKLMRKKEKKSVKDALELGIELFFNYNLHPAIITACKNLDELDIYLDYLENNETNKFDCFKIIFEIPPLISKNKHKYDFESL